MSHIIDADYGQDLLLPPSVEDWLPPCHPARFMREFVDALDLREIGIQWAGGQLGRPAYAASLLLKIWLYGYFVRVRSVRKLEQACRDNLAFIWLSGMHAPDHNTLNGFFRANKKAIRTLFSKTVAVAIKADLVDFALHALDGTKIAARVSNRSGWHREKLLKSLAGLEKELAELEAAIEEAASRPVASDELPPAMADKRQLRNQILLAMKSLDEAGLNHLHPSDADARVMKCQDRNRNVFGYNGQAVADSKEGIVVACEAVQECNDEHQLNAMIQKAEEETGHAAERTVADTGYAAGEELAAAQASGHDVVVSLPQSARPNDEKPYAGSNFTYDAERDVCICPHGGELTLRGVRERKEKGYTLRRYRCTVADCPHRAQCTRDPKGRTLELNQYCQAVQRQVQKLKEPQARSDLSKRGYLIEPVFAYIKEHLGFRRFTVSGIENVQAQWALMCATYNLHKLFNHWKARKQGPKLQPSALEMTPSAA